ncbi:MAG: VWA domain-containing protein [Pyrinomonadaceae bacterium]
MKIFFSILTIYFALFTMVFGQTVKVSPTPLSGEDSVVRISTTLIQVDATVTDKKGNIVKDLKPEDFEIYENGKRQNITNFSFVAADSKNAPTQPEQSAQARNKSAVPLPPVKLRPEQVRRAYAIVVDDLGLSFSNIYFVKETLKKFVNEQMQDGDLVAILRVGGGLGALQSFTSDKRQLLAAIDKIRWNIQGRTSVNSYAAIEPSFGESIAALKGKDTASENIQRDKAAESEREIARQSNIAVGSLGALSYVIRGMSDLPGRKSIMFFSEGFQILDRSKSVPQPTRILEGMRSVAEQAARASVVLYTFDPRGLIAPGFEAQDDVRGRTNSGDVPLALRGDEIRDSKDSLKYLADETGGLAYVNLNNMNAGIQKAINDQNGYYLLGYQPDEETFDPKKTKFNKLEVKVKRPDLKIRYRSGFFGITDEKMKQASQQTVGQKLNAALLSPFGATGINLDLYSVFYNDEKNQNFIRSFMRIDAKDLKFTPQADGKYKAAFDIIAMTFGDNGIPIDQTAKVYNIQLDENTYQEVLQKGLIYDVLLPVKKPGAYQFRIALRDEGSDKIGSASQFIEVPDINKKNLTLSNLIVKNFSPMEWKKISVGQNTDSSSQNNSAFLDTTSRQFKRGTILSCFYVIYNARLDSSKTSHLQVQTRLFRDGKIVLQGSPVLLNVNGQNDLRRIESSNAVMLGTDLQPGDYILQLIVFDSLAEGKNQIATQSIDFEIVE